MPSELRQINFRGTEIIQAVTDYYRRRSLALPAGNVLKLHIAADPAVTATLFVQSDTSGIAEIEIGNEMLAAALILYCINRHIPIPAEAEKRLHRIGEEEVGLLLITRAR